MGIQESILVLFSILFYVFIIGGVIYVIYRMLNMLLDKYLAVQKEHNAALLEILKELKDKNKGND